MCARMESLVSIIVPVYNVEDYIHKCLESIAAQTYPYFECLIIDDGSTDRSGTICETFSKKDARFRVIHQSNSGLGPARNSGLDNANGDFIWFVDGDDTMSPEMLATLYRLIISGRYDWSMVGFVRVDEQGHAPSSLNKIIFDGQTTIVLSGNDSVQRLWTDQREGPTTYSVVWNKLYTRQIIGGLRFENFYTKEDFPFNHRIYHMTNQGIYLRKPLYKWLYRSGSLSETPLSPKKAEGCSAAVLSLRNEFSGEYDSAWCAYLESTYSFILAQRCRIKGSPYYSRFLKESRLLIRNTLFEFLFKRDIPLKKKAAFIALWPIPGFVARHYYKEKNLRLFG